MKFDPKQYAQLLYRTVAGKTPGEARKIIAEFTGMLSGNNDLAQAEKIIARFREIWDKENGLVPVEITSARDMDKGVFGLIRDFVAVRTGAKEVAVDHKLDSALLGGVIIKYRDKVIDASVRSRLSALREKMSG